MLAHLEEQLESARRLLAAILAAIIWTGAGNSLRMARLREHLPELRARALTRRAVPVETDTPLSEALRRANAAGARALVVVDTDGDPLSVVREAAIVGVPEHRRPWVTVGGLAQDITEGMRVPADLSGEELLDRLRATPATEYLVVETSGEIYGVLSAADVEVSVLPEHRRRGYGTATRPRQHARKERYIPCSAPTSPSPAACTTRSWKPGSWRWTACRSSPKTSGSGSASRSKPATWANGRRTAGG